MSTPTVSPAPIFHKNGQSGDCFGCALATKYYDAHQQDVFIGASGANHGKGAVYEYAIHPKGTNSLVHTFAPADLADNDGFGSAIAVCPYYRPMLVVGAPNQKDSQGAVYIFRVDKNGNWSQLLKLTLSDTQAKIGDKFGCSVAINSYSVSSGLDAHLIFVGAKGSDTNKGAVYVFDIVDGVQKSMDKICPKDANAYDEFGSDISSFGRNAQENGFGAFTKNYLFSSPSRDNGLGATYVYKFKFDYYSLDNKYDSEANPLIQKTILTSGNRKDMGSMARGVSILSQKIIYDFFGISGKTNDTDSLNAPTIYYESPNSSVQPVNLNETKTISVIGNPQMTTPLGQSLFMGTTGKDGYLILSTESPAGSNTIGYCLPLTISGGNMKFHDPIALNTSAALITGRTISTVLCNDNITLIGHPEARVGENENQGEIHIFTIPTAGTADNKSALQLAPPYPLRYEAKDESRPFTMFQRSNIAFNWDGTGKIYLGGKIDGSGDVYVDDEVKLTIKNNATGATSSYVKDYSNGDQRWIDHLKLTDITSHFNGAGKYTLSIELIDLYETALGSSGFYLVQKNT